MELHRLDIGAVSQPMSADYAQRPNRVWRTTLPAHLLAPQQSCRPSGWHGDASTRWPILSAALPDETAAASLVGDVT
ncbi:hypothetical protein BCY88_24405 [Paraburkholderia fungorum]|uniref:Uncharacterized protein n=1 Tax=Paraburkholderia fungorum TaxID=134537 RepID=A0A420GP52_9BURK|nr:hypothetical protein BCY88_24405 [Paraburkholderia fungorum]